MGWLSGGARSDGGRRNILAVAPWRERHVHWATDVIGGWCVGAVIAAACALFYECRTLFATCHRRRVMTGSGAMSDARIIEFDPRHVVDECLESQNAKYSSWSEPCPSDALDREQMLVTPKD